MTKMNSVTPASTNWSTMTPSMVFPAMGIKASGGVRTREDALAMVASGADRIGASASVKIVTPDGAEKSKEQTKTGQPY